MKFLIIDNEVHKNYNINLDVKEKTLAMELYFEVYDKCELLENELLFTSDEHFIKPDALLRQYYGVDETDNRPTPHIVYVYRNNENDDESEESEESDELESEGEESSESEQCDELICNGCAAELEKRRFEEIVERLKDQYELSEKKYTYILDALHIIIVLIILNILLSF